MKPLSWLKPGGIASAILALVVMFGLFSFGITSEVPVGSFEGIATMPMPNQGLPNADVILYRSTQDGWEGQDSWRAVTDESGKFKISGLPTGLYSVSIYGKAHHIYSKPIVITEGQTTNEDFLLERNPETVSINAGSRVFTPGQEITVRTEGNTLSKDVKFSIFAIKEDQLDGESSLQNLLYALATNRSRENPKTLATFTTVREETKPLLTKDIEGLFVQEEKLGSLPHGIYLLEAQVGKDIAHAWLTVTDIALVTKTDGKAGEAFVCNITTGEPIAGAEVKSIQKGVQVVAGKTNSDGLVPIKIQDRLNQMVMVSAKHENSRAYTWFSNYLPPSEQITAHYVTDRPIYRPGDLVQFKGTFRKGTTDNYTIPANVPVAVTISDTDGTTVKQFTATLDEWGSFSNEFKTTKADGISGYRIEVDCLNQSSSEWVSLASYRKPYFDIEVTPNKKQVVRGDQVEFTIKCTSLTGEPVAGANVNAYLYKGYSYWSSPFDEDYSDYYYDEFDGYDNEFYKEFNGTTDENGEMVIAIDTRVKGENDRFDDLSDVKFTLDASVSDEGGRYYSSKGSVIASRGEFDIRAEWGRFVANSGEPTSLEIEAATSNADGKLPSQVEVVFGRDQYSKEGWRFIPETTTKVNLDASGKAVANFSPQKFGSYIAKIKAKDPRGNEVQYESYLWVRGGADPAAETELTIALDKKQYEVGDVAEVVVRSNESDGSVWLTAEGDNILSSQIVRLSGYETVLKIPVTKEFAPNFTVTATRVKNQEFSEVSRSANVGQEMHKLAVEITPDRNEIHPGESVNLLVSTKDSNGLPVPADVALRVVDEGVYQISEDREDPLDSFYPRRWSRVQTAYSFPSIYLDGEDKADGEVDIRKEFADTAYWGPNVRTSDDGTVSVAVRVPDNLTSWRVTGTAISANTLVGKGKSNVISRKELMLRMSLPSFMTQDDVQEIAITATNATDAEMTVALEMGAMGAQLSGDGKETLTIPARSSKAIRREVKAPSAGKATFKVVGRAQSGGFTDGLEQSVTVEPRAELRRAYFTGDVTQGNALVTELNLDKMAIQGSLIIDLSPSPFSSLEPMLVDLIDYPYGCVEQTMSRFVPAVLVRDYWRQTGQSHPELDKKIDDVIQIGFGRIRELQNSNGTWGWFGYDQTDPYMTALVLDGLYRIRQAGVPGTDKLIESGLDGAKTLLKEAKTEDYRRMIPLALAVIRYQPDESAEKVLLTKFKDVTTAELAQISLGLFLQVNPYGYLVNSSSSTEQEARKAFAELKKRALSGGQTVSFGDAFDSALALEAALVLEPQSDLASKILKQLMQMRTRRGWGDTWRTSTALKAAVSYMRTRPVQSAAGVVGVRVNGKSIDHIVFSGGADPAKQIRLSVDELQAGKNKVELEFTGSGTALASIELEQKVYTQNSRAEAKPASFVLKREYFRMEPTRLEDGTMRIRPAKNPSTEFKSGEVFRCRLTIKSAQAVEYLAIEDPIPSNCRIVDADKPESGYDWMNWWANSTFFDDHAAFFVTQLDAGEHVIEYAVRAEGVGDCNALPARAYPMYQRDVISTTEQLRLRVKQ
ncbi:MAG: hypothetical protein KF824_03155 [Fimbriimonadaceae bacterium]|nr:MAG: hypothetical protein KF824_03155 [Fimbriimonadaceae bacterium]